MKNHNGSYMVQLHPRSRASSYKLKQHAYMKSQSVDSVLYDVVRYIECKLRLAFKNVDRGDERPLN